MRLLVHLHLAVTVDAYTLDYVGILETYRTADLIDDDFKVCCVQVPALGARSAAIKSAATKSKDWSSPLCYFAGGKLLNASVGPCIFCCGFGIFVRKHVNTIALLYVKDSLFRVVMAAMSAALPPCIEGLIKVEFARAIRNILACLRSDRYVSELGFCLVDWQVYYAYQLGRRWRLEFAELLAYMFVNRPVELLVGTRTVSDVLAASAELTWARLVIYRIP